MPEARDESIEGILPIDPDRLLEDIEAVNRIGRVKGLPGINRVSFSDADMEGRRWLIGRLEDAGLTARMDAVGNVFGRWEVGSGPAVLTGSHLDTVPQGGLFDGTLGVCAALEAVRAMRDAGIRPRRPVEVVCTADEEGRFGGMLGSQAICGEVGRDWIAAAVDEAGNRLSDALAHRGLDPNRSAARSMDEISIFLELHIEQGPVLEQCGQKIGIVDAVSGVFNWTVTLTGEANHSGTTPMPGRRDAFRGLADFGAAIPAMLAEAGGPDSRLTVSMAALRPNFPHSIAGEAVFSIIGRDTEEAVMRRLAEACRLRLDRVAGDHALDICTAEQSWLAPTSLDTSVRADLEAIARSAGIDALTMSSGAGHDAQTFARHCPAGLLFVPSVGGISHAPEEWTDWHDIEKGALLLANAVRHFAMRSY